METLMQTLQLTRGQLEQSKALDFIMAGKSTFTLKSVNTGTRFTYKVKKLEGADIFFVMLLNGSDNEGDFVYLGHIVNSGGIPTLCQSAKSRISKTAPSFIAFDYVFKYLALKIEVLNLEIWHEGRCCRCGRKLTVPESVAAGIGPECAGIMNSKNFSI